MDLVTRTPCCCTGCGRREIAGWTWFCTCTWAMSGSMPLSNVAEMLTCPRELELDAEVEQAVEAGELLLEDLGDAVLDRLGRGAGIVGADVDLGGAMSGYCSIGRVAIAPMPASITMMASTQAKIGRSMKMRDMAYPPPRPPRPGGPLPGLPGSIFCGAFAGTGWTCAADFKLLVPLRDHPVATLEPCGHHPVRAISAGRDDLAPFRLVAPCRDPDEGIAAEVALHRRLRDQIDVAIHRLGEHRLDEHSRKQHALRVGKARPKRHRAGAFVDHDLRKLDRAGVAVVAAVLELQADLRAARRNPARCQSALQGQEVGGRLLDVDIHRVNPLDHRKRFGLVGGDERADGKQRPADPPADRRGDRRVAQIDPRGLERGAGLRNIGPRLPGLGRGVGIILLGDRLDLRQRAVPVGAGLGGFSRSAGIGEVRRRLVDGGLVEARVDLEQRLSLTDGGAFGEIAAANEAIDLRPHFRRLERHGPPAKLRQQRHRTGLGDDIADLGGSAPAIRRVGLGRAARAPEQRHRKAGHDEQPDKR